MDQVVICQGCFPGNGRVMLHVEIATQMAWRVADNKGLWGTASALSCFLPLSVVSSFRKLPCEGMVTLLCIRVLLRVRVQLDRRCA